MLDYRQTQTRSAYAAGMALVRAEKALEHAVYAVRGYAYSRVLYGDNDIIAVLYVYLRLSARLVVFHGVVQQIVYHFLKNGRYSLVNSLVAAYGERYPAPVRNTAQPRHRKPSELRNIDPFAAVGEVVLVKLRKLYYILYERYQPPRFVADILRKSADILRLDYTAAYHVGYSVNAGERGLELVRYVGRKLAAEPVALLALGRVKYYNDRAGYSAVGADRVRDNAVGFLGYFQRSFAAVALERAFDRFKEIRTSVQGEHALFFRNIVSAENVKRGGVVGQYLRVPVGNNKALAHIFRNKGKFRAAAGKLLYFRGNFLVLFVEPVEQRGYLGIAFVDVGLFKVYLVYRLDYLLSHCRRKNCRNNDSSYDYKQYFPPQRQQH